MVKKFFLTLAMMLTLSLSVQGASAQLTGDTTVIDPNEVPGMIAGYSRTYAPDPAAATASQSADAIDLSALMRSVSIMTYEFESDDAANDFFGSMKDIMEEQLGEDMASLGEVEISDDTGLDKDGVKVTMDMGDLGIGMTILVFVDGDTIFMVMVMDSSIDGSTTLATDVSNFITEAEVKDDEVTFNEDGTSTGGVFDRMPASGDDVVGGLLAESDQDIFPDAAE